MQYVFLALAFVCNAGANVLLKLAANQGFTFGGLLRGQWGLQTLTAGSAIFLFGLNLCFYLVALEKIPLSIGYPIMIGMTFVITIVASMFLGEKVGYVHAAGMALIFAGIILIVKFAAH